MHFTAKKCFPNRNAVSSKSDFLENSELWWKRWYFTKQLKCFSLLHWESKTKNRIRIHVRVCFLQRFKNVLLKIFHQTMRIPITNVQFITFLCPQLWKSGEHIGFGLCVRLFVRASVRSKKKFKLWFWNFIYGFLVKNSLSVFFFLSDLSPLAELCPRDKSAIL